jgi:hypothetical protein
MAPSPSVDALLKIIACYAAATGLAEATVSSRFLQRGSRLAELQAGGDMGARHIERVLARFSEEWPADAPWPEGVERPLTPTLSRTGEGAEGPVGAAVGGVEG